MRRMLGQMLEANVWVNMERMLGPMLVMWATGYTKCQIVQHWKQTFGSSHSLHPILEASFDTGHKTNRQPNVFQCQCWMLDTCHWPCEQRLHDATSYKCPMLEAFHALCSSTLTRSPRLVRLPSNMRDYMGHCTLFANNDDFRRKIVF